MTGTTKTCEQCGATFYAQKAHAGQRYCSMKCKGIASRLPSKLCPICGTTWQPHFGGADQPTCSRACGAMLHRNGEVRPCALCGAGVYVAAGRIKATQRIFCCTAHANEWQGRNKTEHTCKMCGKTFRWSPSRTKSYTITYCSLACRDADPARREMLIAMNVRQQRLHPNRVERAGYAILDEIGVAYERQYLIGDKFCVDAFVPSLGVVIQWDGDYWHGNPSQFPEPDARQERRIRLDRSQDAYMATCGYRVERVWASEIVRRPREVSERLRTVLTQPVRVTAARP